MYKFTSADSLPRSCLSLRSRERPLSSARPSRRSCSEDTQPASSSSWASSWRDSQGWSSTPSSRRPRCLGRVPRPPILRPRMEGWAAGRGVTGWGPGERGRGDRGGVCMGLLVSTSFHVFLCFLSSVFLFLFCLVSYFPSYFFPLSSLAKCLENHIIY